jgi:hypothetical protein
LEQQMSNSDESQSQSADLQPQWTPEVIDILVEWRDRADVASKTHFAVANRLSSLNLILGIPVVVLTTLVGTSVFATLQQALSTIVRIFAGFAIVLAAVLASLQTFLSSAERAEKNWAAAEAWAAIRREITEMLALHPANIAASDNPQQYLDKLRARMDEVAKESPGMSNRILARISKQPVGDQESRDRHMGLDAVHKSIDRHMGLYAVVFLLSLYLVATIVAVVVWWLLR